MTVLSEPLIRHLREQAPGCSLALDPVDVGPGQFETQLLRRDLIIGPLGFEFPGRTQPVFTDHLVCVVDESNPRLKKGALTVEDLQEMPHAVAAFGAAGDRRRPLEVAMDAAGVVDRNVLVQVTSLLVLPFAVSGTDMCAFVPVPARPDAPRHPRPGRRRDPARARCGSPRPRTGTRGATASRRWSGSASCSTTWRSRSRTS